MSWPRNGRLIPPFPRFFADAPLISRVVHNPVCTAYLNLPLEREVCMAKTLYACSCTGGLSRIFSLSNRNRLSSKFGPRVTNFIAGKVHKHGRRSTTSKQAAGLPFSPLPSRPTPPRRPRPRSRPRRARHCFLLRYPPPHLALRRRPACWRLVRARPSLPSKRQETSLDRRDLRGAETLPASPSDMVESMRSGETTGKVHCGEPAIVRIMRALTQG